MRFFGAVCFFAAVSALMPAAGTARADSVLVDETLVQPCAAADCTVSGGTFTARGWEVTGPDDRIKVTLPETADSGVAEIDVTNFYPPLNGVQGTASENYCVIFSGFEGPAFDHGSAVNESFYEALSVWCDYEGDENNCVHSFRERSIKLGAVGSDMVGGSAWISSNGQDKEFGWDVKETPDPVYHLRVEWDLAGVTLSVEKIGTQESGAAFREWHFIPAKPSPALRYFFVGQNDSPCDPIMQATYSNLKITKRDVEIPDGGTQTDSGTTDGGVHDAGATDTGPSDAGFSDGGSKDAATGDAGPVDAGSKDTGGGPDAGDEEDAGGRDDSGAASDSGLSKDANGTATGAETPGEETVGCGCATLRAP
ncbi:MAG: hypothetical protein HY897_12285 [Deltaproteobacteria bacterium]|nr:hypothetical protein [Deltaproteobacteria bacterium]